MKKILSNPHLRLNYIIHTDNASLK